MDKGKSIADLGAMSSSQNDVTTVVYVKDVLLTMTIIAHGKLHTSNIST
jgi:hypothetical protein